MSYTEAQLLAARDQHEAWLAQLAGMNGVGIGLSQGGELCLKIFTNRMSASTKEAILARLVGVPIDFEETGEFQAF